MFINLMQSRLFTEKKLKSVSLKDFKDLNWLYTWLFTSRKDKHFTYRPSVLLTIKRQQVHKYTYFVFVYSM